MGLLSNLFSRQKAEAETAATDAPSCPHTVLLPQWDNAGDIGHEDKVTGYRCDACDRTFTRDEGFQLRANEGERVRAAAEQASR